MSEPSVKAITSRAVMVWLGFVAILQPVISIAAVGRGSGSHAVSQLGEATYTIPIVSPRGANGLTPKMALVYSHRNQGSSQIGVGWAISGLSYVTRCPKTWTQDGAPAAVRLNDTDRFCIDGSQLKVESGTYGAHGSRYRTEIETFSRITSYTTGGTGFAPTSGPMWFKVETQDGLIHEYGATEDSRVAPLGTQVPRVWAVSRILDRSGNYISFTYTKDTTNGDFRIAGVAYSGNNVTGVAPQYQINFSYVTQPSAEIEVGYYAGSVVQDVVRLTSVEVLHAASLVRRYLVNYEAALSNTGKSRVSSIQECAGSGGTDCLSATSFSYQNGTNSLDARVDTGIGGNPLSKTLVLDVNGDGRDDIVYGSGAPGSGTWRIAFGTSSGGLTAPVDTGVVNHFGSLATPIDYNSDGRDDVLIPCSASGLWCVLLSTGTSLTSEQGTGWSWADGPCWGCEPYPVRPFDVNGDGLDDLVWGGWDQVKYRLRIAGGDFDVNTGILYTSDYVGTYIDLLDWSGTHAQRGRNPDFDGDGRDDLVLRRSNVQEVIDIVAVFSSTGQSGTIATVDLTPTYADLNGDSYSDVVFASTNQLFYAYSTGNGFTGLLAGPLVTMPYDQYVPLAIDWDSDGYDDVLVINETTQQWQLIRSTGLGLSAAVSTGVTGVMHYKAYVADVNGDGLDDVIQLNWNTHQVSINKHSGVAPDFLQTVTDGFGNFVTFNYSTLPALSGSQYFKSSDATFPNIDFAGPLSVVASSQASNGIGGTFSTTEYYWGAWMHLQGRGFGGFATRRSDDSRVAIAPYTYYARAFPYTGRVTNIHTYQGNPWHLISQQNFTWSVHTYGSGLESRVLPYVSSSNSSEYEVGGAYNTALVRSSATTNIVDAASGVIYDSTTTVTEPPTGANGAMPGTTWVSRTFSPIANQFNDVTNWCIGRPGRTEQTNSHSAYGGTAITRVSQTTWSGPFCRATQQTAEPGSTTLEVVVAVGYDSFGNVNSQSVTGRTPAGAAMAARTTTFNYGIRGQFVESETNALNQTTTTAWNYTLGVPNSRTDPNGLSVSWQYDNFGRVTRESRPDSTATTYSYNDCASFGCLNSNNRTIAIETQLDSAGAYVNDRWRYLDRFDRELASTTRLLSGSYNRIEREFDALGRISRERLPCLWSSCSSAWVEHYFDLKSRPIETRRPVSDTDLTLWSSFVYYEGLTTRTVDGLGKQARKISSAGGLLARSSDHNGYAQIFDYDAFGNAVRVTDSAGNTLQTNTYNTVGNRTASSDMDMGAWTYSPNSLGEIVSQTNAKAQTSTFAFDALGRIVTRTEPEGTSTWTWGNSAANKNIGQLASVSGPGSVSEAYLYDSIGRPSQTTYNLSTAGAYVVNFAYNSLGSLDALTYPTSTSSYRLKLKYEYSYGAMSRIRDFNVPATIFWTANAVDTRGQIAQETLGNGIVANRVFDAVTGWIKTIQSGVGGGSAIQNLSYTWDRVGNLSQRRDVSQNLTETFFYDDLHRLDYSQLGAVTNLDVSYDALGNITSRSDVGTFTYHASKKHAVASTSNGWSFTYDANGNMLTGRGRTISWTSYNYPIQIAQGTALTATFSYGPLRNYWKQVAKYSDGTSTTIYAGSLLEKVTTGTVSDFRHMIRAGHSTIIVSRSTSGANNTYYVTSDHLGSSSAITNGAGVVQVNSSFASFGARRGSNWAGSPSSADWTAIANTTRRGFTEHTMIDNLSLIHMNGRLYDPVVGRFVSADPTVDGPDTTQGWNRYSYAANNPLKYSDPSGFSRYDEALMYLNQNDVDFFSVINAIVGGHRYGDFSWALPRSMRGDSFLMARFGYTPTVGDETAAGFVEIEAWVREMRGRKAAARLQHLTTLMLLTEYSPLAAASDDDAFGGRYGALYAQNGGLPPTEPSSLGKLKAPPSSELLKLVDEVAEISANRSKWAIGKRVGVDGEAAAAAWLEANGYLILARQLHVRTELGLRVSDFVVTDALNASGVLYAFEVKVNSSPYLPTQFAKDALIAKQGGTVVNRFQPLFPYGTKIKYETHLMEIEITWPGKK